MTAQVLGLDIGGANLKAAHTNGAASTVAFPLWKQPDRLAGELTRLCATMPAYERLAITMTGELCDCFPSKREGVQAILRALPNVTPIHIWSTHSRFVDFDESWRDPTRVAAANWLALAHWVARQHARERVLLIDAGSTTTDIVYLNCGKPEPRGLIDLDRLSSGELVYTGVRRTPVCAVLGMEVAAELFATMYDAYLFAGLLPELPNDRDTADGRPATRQHAHARLARMRCADVESFSAAAACDLAGLALERQWRAVRIAVERVLRGRAAVDRIVLAGSGEVLGRNAVNLVETLAKVAVTSLAERLGPARSEAACAYAVACLAMSEEKTI